MPSVIIIYVNCCQQWFHSCIMEMPEIGSGDDKELIFFAILFILNSLCHVIHDVVDKMYMSDGCD